MTLIETDSFFVKSNIQKEWTDSNLQAFVKDAIILIQTFAVPLWSAVPHIYLSALALSHNASEVQQHYTARFCNLLQCPSNIYAKQIQGIIKVKSEVTGIAFSPDGKQIISGSDDQTICVWDAHTLKQIGQPLTGCSDWVTSVAFSPDGKQIVSGSGDQIICGWDAHIRSRERGVDTNGDTKGRH